MHFNSSSLRLMTGVMEMPDSPAEPLDFSNRQFETGRPFEAQPTAQPAGETLVWFGGYCQVQGRRVVDAQNQPTDLVSVRDEQSELGADSEVTAPLLSFLLRPRPRDPSDVTSLS